MNYYQHHLGDYLRDTAHLSMLEDGAYRRLIDAYYIRERPLPGELREVYRLVRASSKQDKEAVDTVLREFFQHTPDGWLHGRCERELERCRAGEADRDAARENAKERQHRARERRRELFEALRSHNVVPPYDTPTSELQRELSRVTSRVTGRDVTPPVTCDDTATHTQTPDPNKPPPSLRSGAPPSSRKTPMPVDFAVSPRVAAWAEGHGYDRLDEHLGVFRRKAAANGYRYADWDSAFMEAIREDWAKLRAGNENSSRNRQEVTRKSAVDRVREANREALEGSGDAVASHDGDLRPPMDERSRRDADGVVVDGAFRVVG